jgi:hypothetical protein
MSTFLSHLRDFRILPFLSNEPAARKSSQPDSLDVGFPQVIRTWVLVSPELTRPVPHLNAKLSHMNNSVRMKQNALMVKTFMDNLLHDII